MTIVATRSGKRRMCAWSRLTETVSALAGIAPIVPASNAKAHKPNNRPGHFDKADITLSNTAHNKAVAVAPPTLLLLLTTNGE
jgi:hypothetical protein